MNIITIKNDEKKRIKLFVDTCKKLEEVSSFNDTCFFYLDHAKNVLEIYATSANGGNARIFIDIACSGKSDISFDLNIKKFNDALQKVRGDEVQVKLEKNRAVLSAVGSTKNTIALAYANGNASSRQQTEVDEIRNFISTVTTKHFSGDQNKIILDDNNRKIIKSICDTTTLLDVCNGIEIDTESVKAADNLCIIKVEVPQNSIVTSKIILNRGISSILDKISKLEISKDNKFINMSLSSIGIDAVCGIISSRWQYPSDAELAGISPEDIDCKKMTINRLDFNKAIEQFKGIFDSSARKYEEVFMHISDDEKDDIHLHYDSDSLSTVVDEYVSQTTDPSSTINSDFECLLPTLHFNKISDLLVDDDMIIIMNDFELDDPHGQAVKIVCGKVTMVVAKLIKDTI